MQWFRRCLQVTRSRFLLLLSALLLFIRWLPGLVLPPARCSSSRWLATEKRCSLSPVSGWRRYTPSNTKPRTRPGRGLRGGMPQRADTGIYVFYNEEMSLLVALSSGASTVARTNTVGITRYFTLKCDVIQCWRIRSLSTYAFGEWVVTTEFN